MLFKIDIQDILDEKLNLQPYIYYSLLEKNEIKFRKIMTKLISYSNQISASSGIKINHVFISDELNFDINNNDNTVHIILQNYFIIHINSYIRKNNIYLCENERDILIYEREIKLKRIFNVDI